MQFSVIYANNRTIHSLTRKLFVLTPTTEQLTGTQGIGIIKGLSDWIGTYQRPCGGINPQTVLSDMREFLLRGGSERPSFPGSVQHVASLWCVGGGNGQRERVSSGTEPEFRGGLRCLQERVEASWGPWRSKGGQGHFILFISKGFHEFF